MLCVCAIVPKWDHLKRSKLNNYDDVIESSSTQYSYHKVFPSFGFHLRTHFSPLGCYCFSYGFIFNLLISRDSINHHG
ncbi:unnamed protein product [Lactuca virosa]|uniref:Uncharacterized protein n=1 Tax=Lactuca virosa TaxID=75947 RepID=A0AAU9PBF7_9ASTR|nr:unnamed protein product [Lactuca virosa]